MGQHHVEMIQESGLNTPKLINLPGLDEAQLNDAPEAKLGKVW